MLNRAASITVFNAPTTAKRLARRLWARQGAPDAASGRPAPGVGP